jgi:putative methyltransferase (TIGR04325 family)
MNDERGIRFKVKWLVKAITPPILILGAKTLLVRLGVMKPQPLEPTDLEAADMRAEPSEWEFVPEGWDRTVPGWDAGGVAEAYARKWPEFLESVSGNGPLGVYHETREGAPVLREEPSAHNLVYSFAYVLGTAARESDRVSVLDWGGGFGHYHAFAKALYPKLALDWHCREVPTVVARGSEINPEVVFHDDDSCLERTYDLVFASGSLQYATDWGSELASLAGAARGLLYVTRLPVANEAGSFVVLQRAQPYGYRTEYIGWVISRDELLTRVRELELELVREFVIDAWFSADGAPETPIGHRGFLLRARSRAV